MKFNTRKNDTLNDNNIIANYGMYIFIMFII